MVPCLSLHAPNAEGPGSIPGQGTRSHMLHLSGCVPQLKISHATAKTQWSQTKKQRAELGSRLWLKEVSPSSDLHFNMKQGIPENSASDRSPVSDMMTWIWLTMKVCFPLTLRFVHLSSF